jgi:hypothetical protein
MYTVIETQIFSADAKDIWNEGERGEFCGRIAENPLAGDVIPGAGATARFVGAAQEWASAAVCG